MQLPKLKPLQLIPTGRLGPGAKNEASGIVHSRKHSGVFWTLGDAGNPPRIYPVHRNGNLYRGDREVKGKGVKLKGAKNVDWEDIAVDDAGNLIVGDIGNNDHNRNDLALYYIDEPSPADRQVAVKKKIRIRYPEPPYTALPEDSNYNAEALFTLGNTVYLLTKHSGGRFTKLYRLDQPDPTIANTLTYVDRFDLRDPAVAADASPDGRRLVIATGKALWLFDLVDSESLFSGPVHWLPFQAQHVEAVCFADENTFLLADEETAAVYEVPIERLVRVR